MANEEQNEAWNGVSGTEWTERQAQYDGMLAPWIPVLDEVAAVAEGESVLDIGCGTGTTTLDAAVRCGPFGTAVGVDLSTPMIQRARARAAAAGLENARFEVGDVQTHDLGTESFDVAVSRFGVMFFDDPVAAFANVGKAMRPGGRLAVLVWGPMEQQQWLTVPLAAAIQHIPPPEVGGGTGMFGMADRDRTVGIFEAAGWDSVEIQPYTRDILLAGGGSIDDTLEFMLATGPGRALLAASPDEATTQRMVAAIRESFGDHVTPDGVMLEGTALAVTARRP